MMDYRSAWFMMEDLCLMWARAAEEEGEESTPYYFFHGKLQFMRKNFIDEGEHK